MTLTTDPIPPVEAQQRTALFRSVRRARWEWWRAAVTRVAVLAIVVASSVPPIAWVSGWLGGRPGLITLGAERGIAGAVLMTFAATFVLALATAGIRSPSSLELLRRADRVFGQAQRLSTAYEVEVRGSAKTLIERALLAEVEGAVGELDWRAVRRARWRPPHIVGVASALALAAVAMIVPVPGAPASTPIAGARVAPSEPDQTAREVATAQSVARLLEAVADAENTPYLRAVASSFDDFANRLAGGEIGGAEAERILEELVGHLEIAARDVGGGFAEALQAALDGAGSGPANDSQTATEGAQPDVGVARDAASDAGGSDVAAEQEAGGGAAKEADPSMYVALEAFVREFEGEVRAPTQGSSRSDPASEDTFYGGVMNADTDPEAAGAQPAGLRGEAQAGGDVVGAAQRSDGNAGDAAGDGSLELAGGDDAFLGIDANSTTSAALPWNTSEDGRFMEVELVPDTAAGSTRTYEGDRTAVGFRRADEAASVTRTIDGAFRDVVSRYFRPGTISIDGALEGAVQ